ncbi:tetratricopeptide repeat domain protein [Synechococcus sp. PCC 7335]|uniref:Sll0314/Alr1548 family TPR repeat-containing protein n=1 Tax=Synechococcus sp. (strain ATCC 29403 / PCC 7335) TaxID=91464 RepID=UPI00017EDD51|nr:Sll0314/Alr1548 family TPR repeat-containing protein [Synechococcus sp. PCC 7335]EDX86631.1 tetratricopeptide repeat domain protein [Synechococcus sp. PCC 7335]
MTAFPNARSASRLLGFILGAATFGIAPLTLAADPFRPTEGHDIGEHTEAAFKVIFEEGNYVAADAALTRAEIYEADEPLVHALIAAMAYFKGSAGLEEVGRRAALTQATAAALKETDRLRGHLYTAVGLFLEGAHMLKTEGMAKGVPRALGMLPSIFDELEAAERINAEDSELNLLKGSMDLMLAVNLPFTNPEQAITRMAQHSHPVYATQRTIAIGYRDLDQYDNALIAVNKALAAAPSNPELFYLKAQILAGQNDTDKSLVWFAKALAKKEQLPEAIGRRIVWENCVAEGAELTSCSELVGY